MQYTVRNIPESVDAALRRTARERGKSLNEVAVEALRCAAGIDEQRIRRRDVGDIAGTWRDDPVFEDAIASQHTIDRELWR